jgi:hypothetical protein
MRQRIDFSQVFDEAIRVIAKAKRAAHNRAGEPVEITQ